MIDTSLSAARIHARDVDLELSTNVSHPDTVEIASNRTLCSSINDRTAGSEAISGKEKRLFTKYLVLTIASSPRLSAFNSARPTLAVSITSFQNEQRSTGEPQEQIRSLCYMHQKLRNSPRANAVGAEFSPRPRRGDPPRPGPII